MLDELLAKHAPRSTSSSSCRGRQRGRTAAVRPAHCRRCGHVWHLDFDPPATAGQCDRCGGELFQRDDDSEDTIRHRLEVYADQTSPLIGYYGDRGLLRGVDAAGPVEDVTERAINALRRFGD